MAPISMTYWGYNVYITHKSSHIEQKCKFLLEEDKNDFRFEKTWQDYLRIPQILFNPALFLILSYLFIYFYLWLYQNDSYYPKVTRIRGVTFWIMLFSFFYTYSFLQSVKASSNKLDIKRVQLKKELTWKCHVNRMTFTRKLKKTLFSFFGIQTDEDGYLVGDKECKELEIRLYEIDESIIDILYQTFTRSFTSIISELFRSVKKTDKLLIIVLSILFISFRPDKAIRNFFDK